MRSYFFMSLFLPELEFVIFLFSGLIIPYGGMRSRGGEPRERATLDVRRKGGKTRRQAAGFRRQENLKSGRSEREGRKSVRR